MNYRHAFHAGNFADVVKHLVLARILTYLKKKPKPFRVIDTHAGLGLYDLKSEEALRTGEAERGIHRVLRAKFSDQTQEILQPYLDSIAAVNPNMADGTELDAYPGSPKVARHLLRPQDRLVVNELHPDDNKTLREVFRRDPQTKVLQLDGWTTLKSLLPVPERRGVVLVDPPFEVPGEFSRIAQGLRDAQKRFATGIFMMWYPIKDPQEIAKFHRSLQNSDVGDALIIELFHQAPKALSELNGSGLIVCNPPFTLENELAQALPELLECLKTDDGACVRSVQLAQVAQ